MKEKTVSYVVRLLYRRNKDEQIVGVVEPLEDGASHIFINRDELWDILMRAGDGTTNEIKPDRMFDK